jgi:hypothetical protein
MSKTKINNEGIMTFRQHIYTHAIDCLKCKKAVIAEFEPIDGLTTLYDYDPYIKNIKRLHHHQADARTRVRVLERVAIEKRLLENRDPGDWIYDPSESQMKNQI